MTKTDAELSQEIRKWATWIGLVFGGILTLSLWGCPAYRVYSQGKTGEARLREAESSRKIAIEEAKAKQESAKMLAEAEIEQARGVAEANKIIGDSLKGNDSYLRYLWIKGLQDGSSEVIYVPTEAQLPILEAGRLNAAKKSGKKKPEE